MAVYRWKTFAEDEDRPDKPRRFGVTEIRGPNHTSLFSHTLLQVSISSFIFPSIKYNNFCLQQFCLSSAYVNLFIVRSR
ncbi:hypothetical protein HanLR1_Chr05g0163371 [Helianthus annuus]|nr:hypothetical protein HanLR1_Chr05g0163371 [Helianthus annuus]